MRTFTALTIAGSDSSGGAGIQADLKTFAALGVFGMSAITALTAQNTRGVTAAVEMEPAFIRQQIDAVADDLPVDACKTGMLSSEPIIAAVATAIGERGLRPYVCDPVMFAKSGAKLLRDEAIGTLRRMLLPLARVVTPNRREAELLSGVMIGDLASAREAAQRIVEAGPGAVIIKAILEGDDLVDLLYDGGGFREYRSPRLESRNTHGSGCTFSAAIAGGLAMGLPLHASIEQAKRLVTAAIAHGPDLGGGAAPVDPMAWIARTMP